MKSSLTQGGIAAIPADPYDEELLSQLVWTGDLTQVRRRQPEQAAYGKLTDCESWEWFSEPFFPSREEHVPTQTDPLSPVGFRGDLHRAVLAFVRGYATAIPQAGVDYLADFARVNWEVASSCSNMLNALQESLVRNIERQSAVASQFDSARVLRELLTQYSKSADLALKSVNEFSSGILMWQRSLSEVMSRISRGAWLSELSGLLQAATFHWAPEALPDVATDPEFDAAVGREIRRLVEQGRVPEARAALTLALSGRPDSQILGRWKHVLTPSRPRLAGRATGRSRRREQAWLREHAPEYQGQWVALDGDRLLAAGSKLAEVRERARATGRLAQALLHFVPAEA